MLAFCTGEKRQSWRARGGDSLFECSPLPRDVLANGVSPMGDEFQRVRVAPETAARPKVAAVSQPTCDNGQSIIETSSTLSQQFQIATQFLCPESSKFIPHCQAGASDGQFRPPPWRSAD